MSSLVWRIKSSLLAYVAGMADGAVETSDGARETDAGFEFPSDGENVFRGTVTMTGHGGMMRVVFRDPALVSDGERWILTIADPDDDDRRLAFAGISSIDLEPDGSRRARGTALTADGADLFFGPYTAGTRIDDPIVRP